MIPTLDLLLPDSSLPENRRSLICLNLCWAASVTCINHLSTTVTNTWDKSTYKDKGFIVARSFVGPDRGLVGPVASRPVPTQQIMVGSTWWNLIAYLMPRKREEAIRVSPPSFRVHPRNAEPSLKRKISSLLKFPSTPNGPQLDTKPIHMGLWTTLEIQSTAQKSTVPNWWKLLGKTCLCLKPAHLSYSVKGLQMLEKKYCRVWNNFFPEKSWACDLRDTEGWSFSEKAFFMLWPSRGKNKA